MLSLSPYSRSSTIESLKLRSVLALSLFTARSSTIESLKLRSVLSFSLYSPLLTIESVPVFGIRTVLLFAKDATNNALHFKSIPTEFTAGPNTLHTLQLKVDSEVFQLCTSPPKISRLHYVLFTKI